MEGLKPSPIPGWTCTLTAFLLIVSSGVLGTEPDINAIGGEFEAAFQGKCGPSSPCVQLCVELHDGTFECQCRPSYRLLLDGYSCVESSNTTFPDEDDSDELEESDYLDTKSPSLAVKAAKSGAAKPSESLQGRPLPEPIASTLGKADSIHKVKVLKESAAAAAADAQEKASFYQKFAPVDDPKGIDFFGLAPDVMAKETAKSLPPVGESKGGRKQGESSSYSGEDEEDSDEGDSDEEDDEEDEDATNEAEEDLSGESRKGKETETHGGGEKDSYQDDSSDEDFILPPRALPLKPLDSVPIPSSFTPSEFTKQNKNFGKEESSSSLSSVKGLEETSPNSNPTGNAKDSAGPSPSSLNPSESSKRNEAGEESISTQSPSSPVEKVEEEECPLKCNKGVCTREGVDEGFRCLCPMGSKGTFCEIDEVFEEGSGYNSGLFRGKSWVAFPVLHDAYMSDQISLEFRPQAKDGILLLTGERDDLSGDYLALFLKDGFLEFRFDCGSGSGIVRSSGPVKLEQWNKASIVRRRWDGWMQLNDGPFTQGRSKGLFSRITFRQPVYIGGQGNITFSSVPSIQSNFDEEPEASFSTSSSQTKDAPLPTATVPPIPEKKEAMPVPTPSNSEEELDSEKLRQRSGDPNNPNANSSEGETLSILKGIGGFQGCVRNLVINDRVYRFGLEPAGDSIQGFDIENCNDQGVCDLVKCQHGGQCLVQKDQVQCLCPLGYSGVMCETPLDLQIPSFNGSSYLKYGGLGLTRVLSWLELEIVVKPDGMDGLILYNGYKTDGMGDFISLIIDQGHIEFAMDLGTGAAIIRSDYPVALGEWHHIHVSRTSRLISLRIDNQAPLMAMTPGAFTQLSLPHNLFLGGIPDPDWLSPKVKVQGGFIGCIQKLVINEKPLRIMGSAMSGVNLENCEHPCLRNPCDHGGDCVPQLDTFKCHCPLGFRDPYCQTRMDKGDVITAPKFIGDSYLRLTHPRIVKRLSGWRLNLSFRLKTESSRGLLLWAGRKWMTSASDFITMGLRNGLIFASFSLGSGQTTIAYNYTAVNDGRWHRVILIRNEQEASLSVDDGPPVTGVAPGKLRQLNINDGLYIGGLEESRHQSVNRFMEGLVGCLTDFFLGSERVSLLQEASEGRNVDYCD